MNDKAIEALQIEAHSNRPAAQFAGYILDLIEGGNDV